MVMGAPYWLAFAKIAGIFYQINQTKFSKIGFNRPFNKYDSCYSWMVNSIHPRIKQTKFCNEQFQVAFITFTLRQKYQIAEKF